MPLGILRSKTLSVSSALLNINKIRMRKQFHAVSLILCCGLSRIALDIWNHQII